ncbi:hypothetical protein ABIE89_000550 [Bradyrhizobium niftali]
MSDGLPVDLCVGAATFDLPTDVTRASSTRVPFGSFAA